MRVLLISRDKNLFNDTSADYKRLVELSQVVEQIHVVVLTEEKDGLAIKKGEKVFLYPTNSSSGSGRRQARDAVRLAELEMVISSKLLVDVIDADDRCECALAAYRLSRKYKVKFLVKWSIENKSQGFLWKRFSNYALAQATGIRVRSQAEGEALSADKQSLADKVFILEEPLTGGVDEAAVDLRAKYPQSNLFLLTVIDSKNKKRDQYLSGLITLLQTRYRGIAIVVIDNENLYRGEKLPNILIERGVKNVSGYLKSVQMYINLSETSKPGGPMTEAAIMGVSVVAVPSEESAYILRNEENGYIVDWGNLNVFAGRVVEILETPGLRERLKLFRHEVLEMGEAKRADYVGSRLGIWKKVLETEDELDSSKVEVYAHGVVKTLRGAREDMRHAAEKVEHKVSSVGESFKAKGRLKNREPIGPIEPLKSEKISLDNHELDIDSVLDNKPVSHDQR